MERMRVEEKPSPRVPGSWPCPSPLCPGGVQIQLCALSGRQMTENGCVILRMQHCVLFFPPESLYCSCLNCKTSLSLGQFISSLSLGVTSKLQWELGSEGI